MTDGILMSSVKIGDVDMSFLDFAGQEEYDYTHPLFLKPEAVYLVVHNPRTDGLQRTEEYFDMIANKAPKAEVIVVTTWAEYTELSEEDKRSLRINHSTIVDIIAVDSKTGKGIEKLKTALLTAAIKLPRLAKMVPPNFVRLLNQLKPKEVAKELFCRWGMLFELSNGDLVLQPQVLAD
eukprot:gene48591-biopygen12246